MIRPAALVFFALMSRQGAAAADNTVARPAGTGSRVAIAERVAGSIAIDGVLDEAAWVAAPVHGGFWQREPNQGQAPTFATEFRVLYDGGAIYVGVRAFDPEPALIRGLLTRRDLDSASDWVSVKVDSYHDRRTAFGFSVNAAGVQRDMLHFNDVESDPGWDAVWEVGTRIDDRGWVAEFRIPYNQLRFSASDRQAWGLQVLRRVSRTQELSAWSPWPREATQEVSLYGTLTGMSGVQPPARVELLPYAVAGARLYRSQPGDQLNDGVDLIGNAGADVKVGLGSNFTLSGTVNPDFGQVEADPSEVNLTARETFFVEKRPFFLEGTDIFRYSMATGNGEDSVETLFYTRRIGAPPHGEAAGDNVDAPDTTTIYGAGKLSGKTAGGWSLGLLDAVTGQEVAKVAPDGSDDYDRVVVEPFTNYAVGRVKKDLREGRTTIGAAATAVNRSLTGVDLDFLHREAYAGAIEAAHRFADDEWNADLRLIGSHVRGSTEALARTQQASQRYYQRPDATHVDFDPDRTSLSGAAMIWSLGKMSGGHWRYAVGGDLRTPGFEVNDLGFLFQSDQIFQWGWVGYRQEQAGKLVRVWQVDANLLGTWNWAGDYLTSGSNLSAEADFNNYWGVATGVAVNHNYQDWTYLRGGPTVRRDPSYNLWADAWSDTRKVVHGFASVYTFQVPASLSYGSGASGNVVVQARSNLDLSLGPSFSRVVDDNLYMAALADAAGGTHHVLAHIEQVTTALTVRASYTYSPTLSLQLYAQPFVSAGAYSEYKEAVAPQADDYDDRYHNYSEAELSVMDRVGSVDGDGDGAADFSFPLGDFSFRELRSNVVLRWEYRPGSALFFIWSHGRTSLGPEGRYSVGDDLGDLADEPGEHVLLAKLNYWL